MEISWLGNSMEIAWKYSINFMEIVWKFLGNYIEIIWKQYGNSIIYIDVACTKMFNTYSQNIHYFRGYIHN
jgi:hypothetical protein